MAKSEDVEDKTPTVTLDVREAVETARSADESPNDTDETIEDDADTEAGDDSADSGDDKSSEDEEDSAKTDDDSDEDPEAPKASDKKDPEYRFTQFAGDGKPESYISNLEKAYENSSAEGIRLNQQLGQANRRVEAIVQAASADKELADKLHAVLSGNPSAAAPAGEAAPTTDPFLVDAKTKWEEQSTKEAQEFIDANPEVVSNPTINTEVKKWMEVFSKEEYASSGKLMSAGEAMSKAYKYLGYEDKREARKSLSDAKKAVAPTRPQGSRKPVKTATDFTDTQLDFAAKLGMSKDKLDKFAK